MWQDILAIIIVIVVVLYSGIRIYSYFTMSKSPCDKCVGCSLKEQINEKSSACKDYIKEKGNNY